MTDSLTRVRDNVAADMEAIQRQFKPGAKIAVLVRSPGFPDRDFMMTDDNIDELMAMLQRCKERAANETGENRRPSFEDVRDRAVAAVKALDDWTNVNETEFTGWGDGEVPDGATWWRIKSGQALKALEEIRERS